MIRRMKVREDDIGGIKVEGDEDDVSNVCYSVVEKIDSDDTESFEDWLPSEEDDRRDMEEKTAYHASASGLIGRVEEFIYKYIVTPVNHLHFYSDALSARLKTSKEKYELKLYVHDEDNDEEIKEELLQNESLD